MGIKYNDTLKKMKTGKIYKLFNTKDDAYYIGSSYQKYLSNRLSSHKRDSKKNRNKNNYLYIYMNKIGLENWFIKELKTVEFLKVRELRKQEDNYIDLNDVNCLNTNNSTNIYRDECKSIKEYYKKIYKKNIINEKKKSKLRWQNIKNDPVKYEEHKKKQRERDRKRRASLKKK